jgi:phospholipase C
LASNEPDTRIEHIVIVMMENRSFDHALGYLSKAEWRLGQPDDPDSMVDGLTEAGFTETWNGVSYSSCRFGEPGTPVAEDPAHEGHWVAWQVSDRARYPATYMEKHPGANPKGVMSYLTPQEVPIYDFLARKFCVCDRWFCSVAGATWPNRMFAVAGTAGGETDIPPTILEGAIGVKTFFRKLDEMPGDDGDGVSWRWYSSDPSLLRAFDRKYRFDNSKDRFAYFDQSSERQPTNFISDLQGGTLPHVSWVDPNFFRLPGLLDDPLEPNDDHPPHEVKHGQQFVHSVYELLRTSSYWDKTLLIVTYDEHGGFYDHVKPDGPLGPRVPTFVISPFVKPGRPCHTPFEHTSIIKTVLERFATPEAIESMGPRVYYANDVWGLMTEAEPNEWPSVTNPGQAALDPEDLLIKKLHWPSSTLQRIIEIADEKDEELVGLQHELLRIYAELRRVLPLRLARPISRLARKLPTAFTEWPRRLVAPLLPLLPEKWRQMPDRQP